MIRRFKKFRGVWYFLGGMVTASILIFMLCTSQYANADQYSCIRTDLNAQGMTGNIPDPAFTITYDVPSCYRNSGYTVQRVYMYGDQVAVHYARN